MTKAEIIQGIKTQENEEDLHEIWDALQKQINQLRDVACVMAKNDIGIGDTVEFDSKQRGQTLQGKVTKCNPKKAKIEVHVNHNTTLWNVPYSMLRKV